MVWASATDPTLIHNFDAAVAVLDRLSISRHEKSPRWFTGVNQRGLVYSAAGLAEFSFEFRTVRRLDRLLGVRLSVGCFGEWAVPQFHFAAGLKIF